MTTEDESVMGEEATAAMKISLASTARRAATAGGNEEESDEEEEEAGRPMRNFGKYMQGLATEPELKEAVYELDLERCIGKFDLRRRRHILRKLAFTRTENGNSQQTFQTRIRRRKGKRKATRHRLVLGVL